MLTLGPVWGPCAACRPVKQDPVSNHDCCKHKPKPDHKNCSHDQRALGAFDKVEKQAVDGFDQLAVVILPDADTVPAPRQEPAEVAIVAFSHAPPGLYLLNSSLLV
jgi:hypothetical protein